VKRYSFEENRGTLCCEIQLVLILVSWAFDREGAVTVQTERDRFAGVFSHDTPTRDLSFKLIAGRQRGNQNHKSSLNYELASILPKYIIFREF